MWQIAVARRVVEGLWEIGVMWTVWEGVRWVNDGVGGVGESFSSSSFSSRVGLEGLVE